MDTLRQRVSMLKFTNLPTSRQWWCRFSTTTLQLVARDYCLYIMVEPVNLSVTLFGITTILRPWYAVHYRGRHGRSGLWGGTTVIRSMLRFTVTVSCRPRTSRHSCLGSEQRILMATLGWQLWCVDPLCFIRTIFSMLRFACLIDSSKSGPNTQAFSFGGSSVLHCGYY